MIAKRPHPTAAGPAATAAPVLAARAAVILAALAAAAPATAAVEIPVPDVQVVHGGLDPGTGRWRAGIEIDLPEGWHTYWRSPGDSGIPPTLTVERGENLAEIDPQFPAPVRYFDGYGTSIVYLDHVLLPLRIKAADPALPVRAEIRLDYGYCREICVPASVVLALDLDPSAKTPQEDAARLARAEDGLPLPEAEAGADAPRILSLAPSAPDVVEIRVDPQGDTTVDLFAEGPPGWYVSPPERIELGDLLVFRLSLDGRPKGAPATGADLRLTLTGRHPVEAIRPLP